MSHDHHKKHTILEKELGIPGDYQYKAMRSRLYPQANWHHNKLIVLKQILKPHKQMRILNLGAGSGNFELAFHPLVKEMVAVDYHDDAMKFLRHKLHQEKIKNVQVVVKDILELKKLKNLGKFDVITLIDVIEHIDQKSISPVILAMKSLLKKEGKICIITPNYKSLWTILEKSLDKTTLVPHFAGHQHVAQYHKENIQKLFYKNGFTINTFQSFNLFSFLIPTKQASNFLVNLEIGSNMSFGNLFAAVFSARKK